MTVVIAPAFIAIALIMLILSEVDLDVRYQKTLTVTFHIYVLAVEFTKRTKERNKEKKSDKEKKKSSISVAKKTGAYLKTLTELIEGSEITVNKLVIPNFGIFTGENQYKENAIFASIISAIFAYLSSKALKLNQSPDAQDVSSERFTADITVKTRVFYVIYALLILRKRLKTAGA